MFYYTNFVQETNVWWMRRVRPIWVPAALLWCYYMFHRYYFFGKWAVINHRKQSEQTNLERAAGNKRYHEKYFVVDGERAVVGGMNIGDEYARIGDEPARIWRDRYARLP